MCTIDWSALGIWVQAAVIACGAVFAACQYLEFKRNEKLKRTLSLLNDYDVVRHLSRSGTEVTAARALPLIEGAANSIEDYKGGMNEYRAGNENPATRAFLLCSDAALAIGNYFNNAERLSKRRLIDKKLFFDAQCHIMTVMIAPLKKLFDAERLTYDLSELEAFVQEARDYLEKHPALKPDEPAAPS